MSRLYEVRVDDKRWKVKTLESEGYPSYMLKDTEECCSYSFYSIIGLEQVTENEFLIFERSSGNDFAIKRYRLNEGNKKLIFDVKISGFEFISDDNIMLMYFTNSASKNIKGIYSISQNKLLDEAKWLDYATVEEYNVNNEEKLLFSHNVIGDNKIFFTVNIDTLESGPMCYSTLRDSFINISSNEDIKKIIDEDRKYNSIISDYMFTQRLKAKEKVKEKLLKNVKEK